MKHRIDDASFAANWFIENVSIFFQSFSLNLMLTSSEFGITSHQLGYNIYLLTVPIVSSNVLITATGVLRQNGTTIISTNQANTNLQTGPIVNQPGDTASDTAARLSSDGAAYPSDIGAITFINSGSSSSASAAASSSSSSQ
jgi:hypothetical protein